MSAVISPCGRYRYRLDRECGEAYPGSLVIAYFGINPSTADASKDDPTVRKWRGFTERNNGHKFIVGNLFSYRSKNPKGLVNDPSPNDEAHWTHIRQIIAEADILVPCWGNRSKIPRAKRYATGELLELLLASGKPVVHFGTTKSGDPLHALMLGYDTPLIPWNA